MFLLLFVILVVLGVLVFKPNLFSDAVDTRNKVVNNLKEAVSNSLQKADNASRKEDIDPDKPVYQTVIVQTVNGDVSFLHSAYTYNYEQARTNMIACADYNNDLLGFNSASKQGQKVDTIDQFGDYSNISRERTLNNLPAGNVNCSIDDLLVSFDDFNTWIYRFTKDGREYEERIFTVKETYEDVIVW